MKKSQVVIIALGLVAICLLIWSGAQAMKSQGSNTAGDKSYLDAVQKQLQQDEKDEYYDKDGKDEFDEYSTPEEYVTEIEEKVNAMVESGKLSAADAAAKMAAIREDLSDKM